MNTRNTQLSKIHIAKKDLGLDDETYRALLDRISGVQSAKDLKPLQIGAVLAELQRLGWKPKRASKAGRKSPVTPVDRQKLMSKVGAFLAEAKRTWAYADGMALRMFKVERVDWLDSEQLRKLVAALTYDAKRHGRPTQ
ncbi:regulatory protein GemA [Pseudomonas marginalis]|uniref:Regulatory protein GemA n=1 Tax=Pseudomonas marginalis TaxID=298 RepID=A0A9X9BPI7_PSEMA|nr:MULTISPECIES: regulatory protein GemA [Pseudomonas]MCD7046654.1 regulatory protein GemA [Pseudomonas petroselini]MCD7068819.1 regulatory protein GemA [Pseudomonas petroselini]MCD7079234.1 regulatory protein GemA [Pseudomonas petroselini]TWR55560.1 regulatory protein GemA [Pseudomonas marginalis]SEC22457.1 Mu-like prophage protein gp16 [Pseudomonas marginalis]